MEREEKGLAHAHGGSDYEARRALRPDAVSLLGRFRALILGGAVFCLMRQLQRPRS